ncbi:hypothetical protein GQ55_3G456800 [Panicum hallii var. hallii]|uniref:Uncharacterized protein n=1 Tax=Panicum hallii var. hallii TaxID=1504633 RepID=A0A2T7EIP9_9POAL|nr:hypothetical protein GQ55_3G456800 [Panicum hallii var. hallii]
MGSDPRIVAAALPVKWIALAACGKAQLFAHEIQSCCFFLSHLMMTGSPSIFHGADIYSIFHCVSLGNVQRPTKKIKEKQSLVFLVCIRLLHTSCVCRNVPVEQV